MRNYLNLLQEILDDGERRDDRTGVGTLSLFGRQLRFDLQDGFPAVTTKRLAFKTMLVELLWFLRGGRNVKWLQERRCRIWDEWADEDGDVGRIYGVQWRSWRKPDGSEVDQIARLVQQIKQNPYSRRHVISAWNTGELDEMALHPCHALAQFYVHTDDRLDCHMYQRSADVFLGVPFNIASYSVLTHMVAHVCGLRAGTFVHSFGDVHLYNNHVEQARLQLSREPMPLPRLHLDPEVERIDDFQLEHVKLTGYKHHPGIKAPIAV